LQTHFGGFSKIALIGDAMEYLVSALVCIGFILVVLISQSELGFKPFLEFVYYVIKRLFKTNKKPGAETPDK